mmetsp:Transcript_17173/g.19148  ORF Transcript_17173/g.19148 Transcript_17173/m.19148 type:complete len:179 (+) Transcript_17173:1194-1730(+)
MRVQGDAVIHRSVRHTYQQRYLASTPSDIFVDQYQYAINIVASCFLVNTTANTHVFHVLLNTTWTLVQSKNERTCLVVILCWLNVETIHGHYHAQRNVVTTAPTLDVVKLAARHACHVLNDVHGGALIINALKNATRYATGHLVIEGVRKNCLAFTGVEAFVAKSAHHVLRRSVAEIK